MVSSWILLLVSIGYAALLFGVAWWGDRRQELAVAEAQQAGARDRAGRSSISRNRRSVCTFDANSRLKREDPENPVILGVLAAQRAKLIADCFGGSSR